MILKIFASLLTGIGGHYLNRRWDRAILFLCLFVFYWAAAYVFFIFSLQHMSASPNAIGQEFNNATQLLSIVSSIGICTLWLVSLIITFLDSKNKVEPNFIKWTKSGLTGAILTSILSSIILAITVATAFSVSKNKNVDTDTTLYESETSSYLSHSFYEYLYFGGTPANPNKLPPPPTGEGMLKGKISYQNNPAEGIALAIVLNSKYRAKDIVTDSEGIFAVSLSPGAWTINSIQTESWQKRPRDGSFTMYYGGEEKLNGNSYNRHAYFNKSGYPVYVTTDKSIIYLNATISRDIQLIWPNPTTEGLDATIDDTISWEKYPEATRYYVEIKKIRREGNTTHYEQVTSRILSNETSLPLSSLKSIKTGGKEKAEYAAEIYAFSDDGSLIAEFSDTYQGGTFLLSDGNILIEDNLDDNFNLSSIEDPDEFMEKMKAISLNKQRANAVSILIDDNLLHEAESLLNLIDSKYSQGQKEVLAGYIFALQGDCNKSNEMFDRALVINPNVCIPDSYKKICE